MEKLLTKRHATHYEDPETAANSCLSLRNARCTGKLQYIAITRMNKLAITRFVNSGKHGSLARYVDDVFGSCSF
jgi:hypothetical protein